MDSISMKIIKQHDHYSCGPIALSNALRLLGIKPPSVKALKKLCRTRLHGRKGTRIIDLKRAAKALGFKMTRASQRRGNKVYIVIYGTSSKANHFVAAAQSKVFNMWNGRYVRVTSATQYFEQPTLWEVKSYV